MQSALDALSPLEPRVSEITTLIDSSRIQVQEACALLRNLADNLDPDPARTDWLDRQLRSIQDLARKHRVEPPQLYACMIDLQGELATLESLDIEFDSIKAELADAESEYLKVAASLTKARANAAQKISVQITEAMQTLGMTGGRFEVNIAPLENEFSASGLERVEFLVCANPGQQPQPLTKVASGGELSRISLAIQVITAEQTSIPTLIYDEVDVGIGGKVAEIVGLRLRQLGILRQVLCITHLPQVAAQGNQHLSVSKINTNEAAAAKVSSLDQEARIKELSRMLGGVKITEQTKAHAKEMIEAASAQAI